jgi:hypothetical protein
VVAPIISLISSLLPIVIFILFCTRTRIKGLWVIFFYCITSLASDSLLNSSWGPNNKFLIWNIYTLVEYSFLSYFFYLIISSRFIKTLIVIVSFIYFIVFFLLYKNNNSQLNSVLTFISRVIILALCLIYIFSVMKQSTESLTILNPLFLIVIALLLYVASTLFLFIMANQLSEKEMNQYWAITLYSNILTNLLYSTAFLLYHFQNKKPPPESRTVDFTSPNDR